MTAWLGKPVITTRRLPMRSEPLVVVRVEPAHVVVDVVEIAVNKQIHKERAMPKSILGLGGQIPVGTTSVNLTG